MRPLLILAALCAVCFFLTAVVALHTTRGVQLDRAAYERLSGNPPALFVGAGNRTLRAIDDASVAAAVLILVFLGLIRGRLSRAIGAAAVVGLSLTSTELFKRELPRIHGAIAPGRLSTLPSGHTAVAASIGLGLILAVPPVLRPTAALAGAAYAAAISFAVVVLGWHYPSDAIASFFLCGFWAAIVGAFLSTRSGAVLSRSGLVVATLATSVALVLAAVVAERHPITVSAVRSQPALVAAGASFGLLSLGIFALFASLVGERPVRKPQRHSPS